MIKMFQSSLDLLKVYVFYVKLESSCCRIYCVNLLARSIENQTQSIESRADCFFCRIPNLAQAHLTCRVLCFVLSIKGKTLTMFWGCSLCYVCESSVRVRGGCLHTYLGFPRFKIMSRTQLSIQLQIQELKDT